MTSLLAGFLLFFAAVDVEKGQWHGKWDTTWGNATKATRMVLKQEGNEITGTYEYLDGRVKGTVDGRKVTGTWTQSNSKGDFEFLLSEDGKSFRGKWRVGSSGPWADDEWNGVRTE